MAEYTYKRFNQDEDVVAGKQKTKTFPIWTDSPNDADTTGEGTLTEFWSSSVEMDAWEGYYYYNVFGESTVTNLSAPAQFSIALATTRSIALEHPDEEYQYTYPSRAVYGQFLSTLEEKSVSNASGFFTRPITEGSTTPTNMPVAYIISIARARIKDRVELDTWQLNLSGSGSPTGNSGSLLTLINETGSAAGTKVVNVIAGTLSDYTTPAMSSSILYGTPFGLFYPERGVIVLDALKIHDYIGSSSADWFTSSGYTPYDLTSDVTYAPSASLDNFYDLINNGKYFRARTTENVQSTHYFCRVKNYEFNYSTNPTWVSGSSNEILDDFYAEPKTFITTIGLYDGDSDSGQLVAVAKVSRPIPKDTETEALIKVKLDF